MQLLCTPKAEGIFCEAVATIYCWWVTHSSWDDSNRKKAKKRFSHIKINVRILFCRDREETWEKSSQKTAEDKRTVLAGVRMFPHLQPMSSNMRQQMWALRVNSSLQCINVPSLSNSPWSPGGTERQHQQQKASAPPLSRFSCLPPSEINTSIWTLIPVSSVPVCLHCSWARLPVELCYWD